MHVPDDVHTIKNHSRYKLLDEINSIHESGHVVIALLTGTTLGYVELSDPSGFYGNTGGCHRGAAPDVEAEVLIKLAGVGAELIFREMGQAWTFLFESSGTGDWKDLQPFLNRMAGDRKKNLRAAKAKVTRFLLENWEWVVAVAERLRENRFLMSPEVESLRPMKAS
jgi:hypothetical protein